MIETGQSRHRYATPSLYGDYVRAGAGLLLTLGPLAATGATGIGAYVLVGLAAVFALFGLRTVQRQHTEVVADAEGISTRGVRRVTVRWDSLRTVKLSYFSTRRDRQRGWMQLMLRGDTGTIRVDSQLEGFEAVVDRAAAAINARGLRVADTTAANFAAYGLTVPVAGLLGEDAESGAGPE
ncbi:MAG: hypothetical protein ACFCVH_08725 [Alphaproteobacteria bacterium]